MAARLSRKDVDDIAALARLSLSDETKDRLVDELSGILDHMAALSELDTAGVEPMTHAVPMELRLRDDAVEDSLPVEVAVEQAPDRAGDFFQVPKIIDAGGEG